MVERAPPFYLKKELRDYGKTRAIFFFRAFVIWAARLLSAVVLFLFRENICLNSMQNLQLEFWQFLILFQEKKLFFS